MSEGKRQLRHWLILVLPFVLLILVAWVAVWGISGIRDQNRGQIRSELVTVLKTTQRSLHVWESDTRADVAFWADFSETRREVTRQLRLPRSPRRLRESPSLRNLSRLLTPLIQYQRYLGYFVLDLQGRLIAGDPERLLGQSVLSEWGPVGKDIQDESKHAMISLPFRMSEGERNGKPKVMMAAVAPMHDESGRTIAILGFYLNPRTELEATMQLGRPGLTGETFAFDRQGLMLTESRFERELHEKLGWAGPQGEGLPSIELRDPGGNLLKGYWSPVPRDQQPLTEMAESATSGMAGSDLGGYRDYRGVTVVGAWLWDEELGLGLATEIDSGEAYKGYEFTRDLVLFMLAVTVGGAFVVSAVIWRHSRLLVSMVERLERAREQLQDAVRARNEFLSIASHELRTPLTSLRMQLELINRLVRDGKLQAFPQAKLIRMTELSSQEIGRMAGLVRNLLEVSRITSGRFDLTRERLDLRELVDGVVERMSSQFAAAGSPVSVHGDESVIGYWDRDQLTQVLMNLLSNAIRYGRTKPIDIEVARADGAARLTVIDRGVGIRKEDQRRIFERFERAAGPGRDVGLGLGLYIVKRIVEQHGGEIRVESEPGRGAAFVVTLPEKTAETASEAS